MAATPGAPTIEDYLFAGDGVVPNNPRLPDRLPWRARNRRRCRGELCGAVRSQWLDRRLEERGLCASSLSQQRARGARHRRRLGPREIGW